MARAKWIFGAPPTVLPDSKPKPKPVISSADAKKFGLENFGNTCYANSVIQALYFCTPFRDLMLQSADHSASQNVSQSSPPVNHLTPLTPVRRKPERKLSTSGQPPEVNTSGIVQTTSPSIPSSPPTLFSALRSLFLYISTHPAEKGTVAPRAFIDKLKEINELFRSTMHQDAHEFLNFLLNKIVEEVEEEKRHQQNGVPSGDDLSNSITTLPLPTPPTVITAAVSSNSGTSPQDATLVHKLFEGVLTSETRCLTCETVSSRDESFLDLSIDIEQNSSVTACLRQFSASEMLCQKNKFFCDACCDLQEAEKRMKIKKLPNILALHLKRFKYQEDVQKYIKLAYRVAFPFELRLFNTVDDTDDADRLYNLFGIVVHIGNGPHHGHYVSIIKTLGSWLVFDDDNVFPITESDIPKYFGESNAGSAYVLYYQAADIDLVGLGLRQEVAEQPVTESLPVEPTPEIAPAVPPGLVEEGDLSDLSDPPFPITPGQSSPLLSSMNAAETLPRAPPEMISTKSDTTISGTSGGSAGRSGKGLFKSMRSPSTSTRASTSTSGPDPRRSIPDRLPRTNASSPALRLSDDAGPLPPIPPQVEKEREEEIEKDKRRKDSERKASTWFGKRKNPKPGEKSAAESTPSDDPSRGRAGAADSTASSSSGTWFRTVAHPSKEKRSRRPSEPNLFETNTLHNSSTVRPVSDDGGSGSKPDHHRMNGYEIPPPGSASSSLASTSVPHSSSHPPTEPPQRKPALPSFTPPERHQSFIHSPLLKFTPDRKKSVPNLRSQKDKVPTGSLNASLSRSPSTRVSAELLARPLPPVPPLPSPKFLNPDISNGRVLAAEHGSVQDNGKRTSHDDKMDEEALGLGSFVDANHSTSTTSSSNSNLMRATRKLSLSAPMLGFGKKDKEKHKDRERDKEKGPQTAFTQFSMPRF